ncbi:hypothetical protein ACSNOJ_34885, partial [Streptomyces sp. URMC 128]
MQHGTTDGTCPPPTWSRQVAAAFERAGKDVELRTHAGEGHTFGPRWLASIGPHRGLLRTPLALNRSDHPAAEGLDVRPRPVHSSPY